MTEHNSLFHEKYFGLNLSFIKIIRLLKEHIHKIKALLSKNNYSGISDIKQLPLSGSNRIYFRIVFENQQTVLAAYNPDISENIAWYSFTQHFLSKGLPVPEIFARDESYRYFLLQDLGSDSLFNQLAGGFTDRVKKLYTMAVLDLVHFQTKGIDGLDLDVAYPVSAFDKKSVLWDLNYFKYYFVKPHELSFNESKLEVDFQRFTNLLLIPDPAYFQYRDFQARNIMIHDDKLWYIDFQGGRRGPLQYDLVSLLYQAKANLPVEFREELYMIYQNELEKQIPGSKDNFNKYFPYFIYFRLMQVLGAYGFRGLIQRKGHFLNSIPFAVNNLKQLLEDHPISTEFPELTKIFKQIINLKQYEAEESTVDKLTVSINSFSFKKKGYPLDKKENGGGFVFDCRSLPNPGRIAELRNFTGRDKPIIDYLEEKVEVEQFLENAFKMVDQSITNYLDRGFDHLQVNFGCTGGQHRSVYSTERLKTHLQKYGGDIVVLTKHHEIKD